MSDCRIHLGADLKEHPDCLALADTARKVTYRDYHRLVAAAAERLKTEGITPGQRVAVYAQASPEYIINLMALISLGAVACPVSVRFPNEVVSGMLDEIDCSAVLLGQQQVFKSDALSALPMNWPDNLPKTTADIRQADLNRPATIIFTSGTTARPRAALLTLGNHFYNALGSNENIKLAPGQCWLLSLPLHHVGGISILFRCLLSGATVAVPDEGRPLIEAVKRLNATHLSLVPTQLIRLLDHPDLSDIAGQLKAVLVGGGPIGRELVDSALDSGLPLYTTYGCTEMASQVTTTGPNDPREKLHTSGRVLNHREIRIDDDDEILVRGKTRFSGYAHRDGVSDVSDRDGWFRTGDLGRFDSDGYLSVIGRKDNMFISGGENIHPEEIEEVLRGLPGIDDAVVVPVDDAQFGRRPVAFVRRTDAGSIDLHEIPAALVDHLPRFKIPVKFLDWPNETESAGIKPDRRHLAGIARSVFDRG